MSRAIYQHYTMVDPNTVVVETKGLYATVGRRIGAVIIDLLFFHLLIAILYAAYWYYGDSLGALGDRLAERVTGNRWSLGILYLLSFSVLNAILESSSTFGTVGKRILGLALTDVYGFRLQFQLAFLRNIFKYLTVLSLGSGLLLAKYTVRKQALHDLLTGSVVVNREIAMRG